MKHYTVLEKILLNTEKKVMKQKNKGFDDNFTYYEYHLNTSDIPTIFIHGVGLDQNMWLPQKKFFSKKQVIFYDLLNHGKSKKEYKELNFDNFNIQIIKLIEFLNIKKFNLVGFSIGSLIAQHFTEKYSELINKLVIIASVYKRSKHQIQKVKNRYKMACAEKDISHDSIKRWFNSNYLESNPNIRDYFLKILKKKENKNFLPAYKLFVESDNYYLDFSNFKMPTLIMTGENEIGSTPIMSKKIHQKIKNSKLYIVPKAKHMVTFEYSNIVNSKISKFIYQ